MKTLAALTLATALCLALPAVAQDRLPPASVAQDGVDDVDHSDHYNNQSSIVPDTVPDNVHHNTARGQVASDRAKIAADEQDLQAHKAHERQQMQKDQQDLHGAQPAATTGHPAPLATQ